MEVSQGILWGLGILGALTVLGLIVGMVVDTGRRCHVCGQPMIARFHSLPHGPVVVYYVCPRCEEEREDQNDS